MFVLFNSRQVIDVCRVFPSLSSQQDVSLEVDEKVDEVPQSI